jgi:inosine-uridine nucleoside N-ribohydrolase
MKTPKKIAGVFVLALLLASTGFAQDKRYVIIDQDASGPAGTDLQSMLVLLQAPNVDVLGITLTSGDAWVGEAVAHSLRLLELVGRTEVPVAQGAVFPLIRTQESTRLWQQMYGKVEYLGAWRPNGHGPFDAPEISEGNPTHKPLDEDAAHFLVRTVHSHPNQVTIYAGGPMTNLALAIAIDPHFPELTKGLVFMGGSINPHTDNPEFATNPRHEFNLWWDPEAAHIVLRAHWPSIVCTTVDVSIQTRLTEEMLSEISKSEAPAAKYMAKYSRAGRSYLWDELAAAAWLEPKLITSERLVYMDMNLDRGPGYGDTLIWAERNKPALDVQLVHAQMEVDVKQFERFFVKLMTSPKQ